MFTAAAGSGVVGRIDPLVNIIVDQTTLEHHLARLAGADVEPLDPATVDERRCETSSGHQIDPNDMLAAALIGHVRRVVFDTAGVVIDLGRRTRLFTGGPATRSCWVIDGVCGPDATFAPDAAKPTTPNLGPR